MIILVDNCRNSVQIKNTPVKTGVEKYLYIFLSTGVYLSNPADPVLGRFNANYFFVKQLELLKRVTNFIGTQNLPHY